MGEIVAGVEDGDGWIKCWVETHKYEKEEMIKLLASLKEVALLHCAETLLNANPATMSHSEQIVTCFLDEIFTVNKGVAAFSASNQSGNRRTRINEGESANYEAIFKSK